MMLLQTTNTNTSSRFNKKLVIMIASVVIVLFAFAPHVYALTLSPARIEISGDPGATVGGQFTLINEQSTTQTYYVSYENFGAQGETGSPAFTADKTGLDTWLTVVPTTVTLAPGQSQIVPYSIAIPKNTDPGGYFAAIFWSDTPPSGGSGQVSIGAKVGLLVLLSVNGKVTESAGINQFDRDGHGFFYKTLPVTFRYKFRNSGGDRVEPVGTMTIRDTVFLPTAKLDGNAAQGNILPGSTRQFTVQWVKQAAAVPVQGFFNNVSYEWQNFAVGLYSANLNLMYGTQGGHVSKTVWFFVLPWQLLLCILVAIVIIWWGGKSILTRYNRYIIKQARATMTQQDVSKV